MERIFIAVEWNAFRAAAIADGVPHVSQAEQYVIVLHVAGVRMEDVSRHLHYSWDDIFCGDDLPPIPGAGLWCWEGPVVCENPDDPEDEQEWLPNGGSFRRPTPDELPLLVCGRPFTHPGFVG